MSNAHGELRRITGRPGTSLYRSVAPPGADRALSSVTWETRTSSSYGFCSRERPAYAFSDQEGRLIVHYLDLFGAAGYQLNSATMYMRLCHDMGFDWEDSAPLRRLGYGPGTRSEQVEDLQPEDLARF